MTTLATIEGDRTTAQPSPNFRPLLSIERDGSITRIHRRGDLFIAERHMRQEMRLDPTRRAFYRQLATQH